MRRRSFRGMGSRAGVRGAREPGAPVGSRDARHRDGARIPNEAPRGLRRGAAPDPILGKLEAPRRAAASDPLDCGGCAVVRRRVFLGEHHALGRPAHDRLREVHRAGVVPDPRFVGIEGDPLLSLQGARGLRVPHGGPGDPGARDPRAHGAGRGARPLPVGAGRPRDARLHDRVARRVGLRTALRIVGIARARGGGRARDRRDDRVGARRPVGPRIVGIRRGAPGILDVAFRGDRRLDGGARIQWPEEDPSFPADYSPGDRDAERFQRLCMEAGPSTSSACSTPSRAPRSRGATGSPTGATSASIATAKSSPDQPEYRDFGSIGWVGFATRFKTLAHLWIPALYAIVGIYAALGLRRALHAARHVP